MEAASRIPWWVFALQGLVLLIFGILAIVLPGITLLVLMIAFGAFLLVDGVFAVAGSIVSRKTKWWLLLPAGVVSIVIGILVLAWPDITALVLLYLIALWAVIAGVMQILTAIFWPAERKTDRWLLVLGGLVALGFGVLMFAWPAAGALAIIWLIAVFAILFGIMRLGLAFSVRKSTK